MNKAKITDRIATITNLSIKYLLVNL